MTAKPRRIALINTVSGIFMQLTTLLGGFIIPKLILDTFGSETNGLISSLNQFLNYIALLEGGLNGVVMASLYKPLSRKNYKKVGSIVATSRRFFRRISLVLIIYSVGLAVVYPLITHSSFSFGFICSLTMILTVKLFAEYCFSFTYKNLLNASKNGYIVSLTGISFMLLDIINTYVVCRFFPSIHILKLVSALLFLIQPFIFIRACKKLFPLDEPAKIDNKLIASRWDGLSINIAFFVHTNTDIALLTLFKDLQTVSVYSIHAMVAAGLRNIVSSTNAGIVPSIGAIYASGDKKKFNQRFDLFEYINFVEVFFLFGVGALLLHTFIMTYTRFITDADYYQPTFGLIFLAAEAIYMLRDPYVNLSYIANRFRDQNFPAYTEAAINIILSLALVGKHGLIGIAIGTFAAMLFRITYQIWYLKRNIIFRPVTKFLRRFLAFFIPVLTTIILCFKFIPVPEWNIYVWLGYACIYSAIMGVVIAIVSFVFFRSDVKQLIAYLKHRK